MLGGRGDFRRLRHPSDAGFGRFGHLAGIGSDHGNTIAPELQLVENPDILATISKLRDKRPGLVIGFAAETENLIDNAKAKLARKGCDWIVANDVSPATGVMGGDRNTVHLLTREGAEINVDSWPVMTKEEVATELVARIAKTVEKTS